MFKDKRNRVHVKSRGNCSCWKYQDLQFIRWSIPNGKIIEGSKNEQELLCYSDISFFFDILALWMFTKITRMHSNRMRTNHVSDHFVEGVDTPSTPHPLYTPMNRMTHACGSITFHTMRSVIIHQWCTSVHFIYILRLKPYPGCQVPIFSYFSQHTPIFPIFQQFPPIFPMF